MSKGRVVSRWLLAVLLLPVSVAVADRQPERAADTPAATAIASIASEEQLAERAVIRRDEHGVPHILADTEEAAALAHGYVTAEDHGALLARAFLRARGTQASVFGAAFADEDIRVHTLRIPEAAAARFHELPPFMQAIVNAYAAGYNRYLTRHRSEMPVWATPVTGVDVLAHCRVVLLLDFALDLRAWNQSQPSGASNMWAIAPSRSQSGRAMLLANPHLPWNGPDLFHEVHITVPGAINVSGATFVGVPVVTIGFNDVLGWTHTVNRFDSDDVYELRLDASKQSYEYDGRWLPLEPRPFAIDVKTGGGVETLRHTALWSHYGPVIRTEGDTAYAFKSPNLDAINFLTQYNAMGKAASLETFTAAIYMQQLPALNVGYADKAGNIWYLFNGRIPIRPDGYNWAGVVPGHTSRSEWFTVRPVSELPQLLNPKSGYVQNCNDAPWYANLEHAVDRSRFADYLALDGMTSRGQRSLTILSSDTSLTLDELVEHKFDAEVPVAGRLKAELVAALEAGGDKWRDAVRVLEAWDNSTDAASRGSVLFQAWWNEYTQSTTTPFRTPWTSTNPIQTPAGLADQSLAVVAFGRAVAAVTRTHGALDVAWGETHRARRGTLDLAIGGSDSTLGNVSYTRTDDGKDVAAAGDTYVLAVEFGPTPRAYSVMTYSQSSDSSSPYFNNQLALYAKKQLKRAWFSENDVAAHVKRRYRPGE